MPYHRVMMQTFLTMFLSTLAGLLLAAGLLHLLPRLGVARLNAALCRAPMLDVIVTWFLIVPLVAGPIIGGWIGLAGAIVGQVASLLIWQSLHELANARARKGPRIVKVINRLVGRPCNHAALWVTAITVPVFWLVRMAQILLYPWLTILVGLPRYNSSEWVNVSRHKFDGLVGHDLIWCLYCDWMTGIWSLGSEMLRNVESFWCPIRFDHTKKCENCKIDFPDVDGGWVPADRTMKEVTDKLHEMYDHTGPRERSWFGHQARLTIHGHPPQTDAQDKADTDPS
jgi:hypothetical protein